MKALVFELWGLGDATLASTAIRRLLAESYEVTMLCKASSAELLSRTYPSVHYEIFDAPWTAFRGKYHLWRWRWLTLLRLILKLRSNRFDLALGWRRDPRDHLLMWLAGARSRVGRPTKGSRIFLTRLPVAQPLPRHSVDCWRDVLESAGIPSEGTTPWLAAEPHSQGLDRQPIFVVHCGAQQPVRRWPASYWRELILRLRKLYKFQLVLMPDPDGFGMELADAANDVIPHPSLTELTSTLANADLVLCNDSAPAHIAAATDTPVIAFFGPQLRACFAPFGADHLAIARDICAYRPCFDYCHFSEPYCLTKLTVNEVWPEIQTHIEKLINTEILSKKLRKSSAVP